MAHLQPDDKGMDSEGLRPGRDSEIEAIQRRLDAIERRLEHRLAEIRAKQEEELMLIKALACQLRGRGERADRRGSRAG